MVRKHAAFVFSGPYPYDASKHACHLFNGVDGAVVFRLEQYLHCLQRKFSSVQWKLCVETRENLHARLGSACVVMGDVHCFQEAKKQVRTPSKENAVRHLFLRYPSQASESLPGFLQKHCVRFQYLTSEWVFASLVKKQRPESFSRLACIALGHGCKTSLDPSCIFELPWQRHILQNAACAQILVYTNYCLDDQVTLFCSFLCQRHGYERMHQVFFHDKRKQASRKCILILYGSLTRDICSFLEEKIRESAWSASAMSSHLPRIVVFCYSVCPFPTPTLWMQIQ